LKHGILLLCKDEIEALRITTKHLNESIDFGDPNYYILFVDGNSKDGSFNFLIEQGFSVHSQVMPGMRSAINEGVKILLDNKVDSITFAQPDGNCDLTKIKDIITPFQNKGLELIIGSRYIPPAISLDDDAISKFGNKYFSKLISVISGQKYFDAMVGYRTFSSELVFKLDLLSNKKFSFPEKLFSTSLGWDPIMSTMAPTQGVQIMEVPVTEPPRIGGKVKKQTIKWGLGYTYQIISFWLINRFRKRF
jgi:hypothetical protein